MKKKSRKIRREPARLSAAPAPSDPGETSRTALMSVILAAVILVSGGALAWFLTAPKSSRPPTGYPAATNLVFDPIGTSVTTNAAPADDPGSLVNRGNQLLQAGKTEEALALYERARELSPDDEDVHYNLGIAYARKGRTNQAMFAKAIEHYQTALKLVPEYAEVHNNLGNLYLSQGNFPSALEHFNAAIRANPDYAVAHNNLGKLVGIQGNVTQAMVHFQEAVRLMTNYVEARFNLALAYLNTGKRDEGILELKEILRERPDFELARQALAKAQAPK